MKRYIINSSISAVVASFIAVNLLVMPDFVTQLIMFGLSFISVLVVLVVFIRIVSVAEWPSWKRGIIIWLIAGGVAVFTCFIPRMIFLMQR
jgi:hypothetical protein